MKLEAGTIMDLDLTGVFYSTVATKKHPGTFGEKVILNEEVNKEALQRAVNRLYDRLPFLSVKIVHVGKDNKNEVMGIPAQIEPDTNPEVFTRYFAEGEMTSRVLYGKDYFTMEVLHSVCDGGTLTKILKALTIAYFRELGVQAPYQEIDLDAELDPEEFEDPVLRLSPVELDPSASMEAREPFRPAYTYGHSFRKSYLFDCNEVKKKAKDNGITVTEYIIANIILELDKERSLEGSNQPININIPIDCRKYFPSKTLRNFVSTISVEVDHWDSIEDLYSQIHSSMKSVTEEELHAKLYGGRLFMSNLPVESYEEKKKLILGFEEKYSSGRNMSACISNVGLVRYPEEIASRVRYVDFTLCPEEYCGYQFAVVTCGNVLCIDVTYAVLEEEPVNHIMESIRK